MYVIILTSGIVTEEQWDTTVIVKLLNFPFFCIKIECYALNLHSQWSIFSKYLYGRTSPLLLLINGASIVQKRWKSI